MRASRMCIPCIRPASLRTHRRTTRRWTTVIRTWTIRMSFRRRMCTPFRSCTKGPRLCGLWRNGWEDSGLIRYCHTGDALTITAGSDVSLTGLNQDRGVKNAGVRCCRRPASASGTCVASVAHCWNWLTPGAFTKPTNTGPGTVFGNVVKGSIRGPRYVNWDAAVIRDFPIYRESQIQFRVEYFDLMNHTILGNPTTNFTACVFTARSHRRMRQGRGSRSSP